VPETPSPPSPAPLAPLAPALEQKTIEDWRDAKKTEPWIFAAAVQLHTWPIGKLVSGVEYEAALTAVGKIEVG
jgi:hypothetical protein